MPITFLGMAQGGRSFEPEDFIGDPEVAEAVESIEGAATDAARLAAVQRLMGRLG
ncbi:hypothetical protein KIH74_09035 [Kineosporia sp. J2-2]|uniref:Uncharacterized protein n=1 Tax=Kineosporia corallincola TaxID=2835133 RepID=A0ABS5TDA0_9ACTN|nr:hypothetical protein [Kineosporia corallincola]MBT0769068.1 hypothetical protein [Kineosporia corallincola]